MVHRRRARSAFRDVGGNRAEADSVHMDDLSGIDRPYIRLCPVLTRDCTGGNLAIPEERCDDLREIERRVVARNFGLNANRAVRLRLDVPRDDEAHAGGRELRHRDFSFPNPHGHVAEPGFER